MAENHCLESVTNALPNVISGESSLPQRVLPSNTFIDADTGVSVIDLSGLNISTLETVPFFSAEILPSNGKVYIHSDCSTVELPDGIINAGAALNSVEVNIKNPNMVIARSSLSLPSLAISLPTQSHSDGIPWLREHSDPAMTAASFSAPALDIDVERSNVKQNSEYSQHTLENSGKSRVEGIAVSGAPFAPPDRCTLPNVAPSLYLSSASAEVDGSLLSQTTSASSVQEVDGVVSDIKSLPVTVLDNPSDDSTKSSNALKERCSSDSTPTQLQERNSTFMCSSPKGLIQRANSGSSERPVEGSRLESEGAVSDELGDTSAVNGTPLLQSNLSVESEKRIGEFYPTKEEYTLLIEKILCVNSGSVQLPEDNFSSRSQNEWKKSKKRKAKDMIARHKHHENAKKSAPLYSFKQHHTPYSSDEAASLGAAMAVPASDKGFAFTLENVASTAEKNGVSWQLSKDASSLSIRATLREGMDDKPVEDRTISKSTLEFEPELKRLCGILASLAEVCPLGFASTTKQWHWDHLIACRTLESLIGYQTILDPCKQDPPSKLAPHVLVRLLDDLEAWHAFMKMEDSIRLDVYALPTDNSKDLYWSDLLCSGLVLPDGTPVRCQRNGLLYAAEYALSLGHSNTVAPIASRDERYPHTIGNISYHLPFSEHHPSDAVDGSKCTLSDTALHTRTLVARSAIGTRRCGDDAKRIKRHPNEPLYPVKANKLSSEALEKNHSDLNRGTLPLTPCTGSFINNTAVHTDSCVVMQKHQLSQKPHCSMAHIHSVGRNRRNASTEHSHRSHSPYISGTDSDGRGYEELKALRRTQAKDGSSLNGSAKHWTELDTLMSNSNEPPKSSKNLKVEYCKMDSSAVDSPAEDSVEFRGEPTRRSSRVSRPTEKVAEAHNKKDKRILLDGSANMKSVLEKRVTKNGFDPSHPVIASNMKVHNDSTLLLYTSKQPNSSSQDVPLHRPSSNEKEPAPNEEMDILRRASSIQEKVQLQILNDFQMKDVTAIMEEADIIMLEAWTLAMPLLFNLRKKCPRNLRLKWNRERTVVGGSFVVTRGVGFDYRFAPAELSCSAFSEAFNLAVKQRQSCYEKFELISPLVESDFICDPYQQLSNSGVTISAYSIVDMERRRLSLLQSTSIFCIVWDATRLCFAVKLDEKAPASALMRSSCSNEMPVFLPSHSLWNTRKLLDSFWSASRLKKQICEKWSCAY